MNQTTARRPRVSALERQPQQPFVIDPAPLVEAQEILDERLDDTSNVLASNQEKTSGFLRVEATGSERNPYAFTGILLPYEWEDVVSGKTVKRLRNRVMVVGRYAREWFEPFCKDILDDGTNIRLRVRVNLHNDNLAFILPGARTPEHAKAEWTVAQAAYRDKLPVRLFQYTPAQLSRKVYERAAVIHGGSITHFLDDTCQAIAVDRFGYIQLLSNGQNIERFSGSLQRHEVIMDRNITSCISGHAKQLNSLEELYKYLDRDDVVDVNTLYRS